MSYQVLARKWRPRVFKEMVGQEHVLKALINALDRNRLHHAYLFTGTRGVGKTTIARILAKCLNCEQGVTSEPCDQCAACVEINEGRFVDLIEVDAASRTKVEDTRELLDNVQYAPSKGRFKVYLIDEVHMLSGHSFNALLKTLEEPPPHVKFLLATTDPQKLPVTILSRCLQFNLKNLGPERIVEHLQFVLGEENVPFEESALWQLGRSADGSMRDALSLTDQAISFGEGKITETEVNAMLGSIDRTYIVDILRALQQGDGAAILQHVERMAEHSPDYEQALAELINMLHRLAVAQVVPETIDNTFGDRELVLALGKDFSGDEVQLFYQMALLGRRDLPLAPEPRGGFEMVLLRLLAFKPVSQTGNLEKPQPAATNTSSPANDEPLSKPSPATNSDRPTTATESATEEVRAPAKKPEAETAPTQAAAVEPVATPEPKTEPKAETTARAEPPPESIQETQQQPTPELNPEPPPVKDKESTEQQYTSVNQLHADNWNDFVAQLSVGGVLGNTLSHCQYMAGDGSEIQLLVDQEFATLYDASHQQRIAQVLSDFFQQEIAVQIQVGNVTSETPAAAAQRARSERQAQALESMRADPLVRDVIQTFSATLQEDSVVPIDH